MSNVMFLEIYKEDIDDYVAAEVHFNFHAGYPAVYSPVDYAEPGVDDEYVIADVIVQGESTDLTKYEEDRIIEQLIQYRRNNF